MKQRVKKQLSILFSLVLAFGLLSGLCVISNAEEGHIHDGVTFTEWSLSDSLPEDEGNYYLTVDVELENTWVVSNSIKLCLNGHSITYTGDPAMNPGEKASVIYISNENSLDLYDCDTETTRRYTISEGLGTIVDSSEEDSGTITGGYITGGKGVYDYDPEDEEAPSWTDGGAVYVGEKATFTMVGGNIIGNQAVNGGGVYVDCDGVFNMSKNAVITGNTMPSDSEGRGAGVYVAEEGTFNMSGGSITINYSNAFGGGVHCWGNVIMTGGEITDNYAYDSCGGLFVDGGEFHISGSPVIKDNYEGGDVILSNVIVKKSSNPEDGTVITIDDALTGTSSIGVTQISDGEEDWGTRVGGVFTSGGKGSSETAKYFTSDDNSFAVWVNNNELALGKTCTVYFNANGHGTAPESQKVAEGDKVKKPSNLTDSGWTFGGWYKEAACTNEWKFDTDAVSGDTTLYAKWTEAKTTPSTPSTPSAPSTPSNQQPTSSAPAVNSNCTVGNQTYKVLAGQKVCFTKAKNAKNVTVPDSVTIGGLKYDVVSVGNGAFSKSKAKKVTIGSNVNKIESKAFNKSKVTTLVIKSKKLTKKSVKNSLKGSIVTTVKVKVGKKKENNKFVKKYKKIFTKKNAGKKAAVK